VVGIRARSRKVPSTVIWLVTLSENSSSGELNEK
jgi:hypothetical protein